MSQKLSELAAGCISIPDRIRQVLIAICRRAHSPEDPTGYETDLAGLLGMAPSNVRTCLSHLVRAGLIRDTGERSDRSKATIWEINVRVLNSSSVFGTAPADQDRMPQHADQALPRMPQHAEQPTSAFPSMRKPHAPACKTRMPQHAEQPSHKEGDHPGDHPERRNTPPPPPSGGASEIELAADRLVASWERDLADDGRRAPPETLPLVRTQLRRELGQGSDLHRRLVARGWPATLPLAEVEALVGDAWQGVRRDPTRRRAGQGLEWLLLRPGRVVEWALGWRQQRVEAVVPEAPIEASIGAVPRPPAPAVWLRILAEAAERVTRENLRLYFEPMDVIERGGELVLVAPDPFHRDWVELHYQALLEELAGAEGRTVRLELGDQQGEGPVAAAVEAVPQAVPAVLVAPQAVLVAPQAVPQAVPLAVVVEADGEAITPAPPGRRVPRPGAPLRTTPAVPGTPEWVPPAVARLAEAEVELRATEPATADRLAAFRLNLERVAAGPPEGQAHKARRAVWVARTTLSAHPVWAALGAASWA